MFCENGIYIRGDNGYVCAQSELKGNKTPCETDDDCVYSVYDGTQTQDIAGECVCNLNQTKVCTSDYDTSLLDTRKKIVEVFMKNYQKGKIHVAAGRDNYWGLRLLEVLYKDSSEYKGLDKCVIENMIGYKLLSSYIKVSVWGITILLSLLL